MNKFRGITLIELLIVVMLMSLLTTFAVPAYNGYVERANIAKAIADIKTLELSIEQYRLRNNDRLPPDLDALGIDVPVDPWGQAYVFTDLRTVGVGGSRKDGRLKPINTDFDLYSVGKDGQSRSPLNAKASRDDIVRANDGAYVGLAEEY